MSGNSLAFATQIQPSDSINLKGIISLYDGPAPDQLVGNLVTAALLRDETHEKAMRRNEQMKGTFQRTLNAARVSANYMLEYRGFEMSSEAADVILDEKLKLKSTSSTEYITQKKADEVHAKVFSSLLQMAEGLGTSDPASRDQTIEAGLTPLTNLVGKETADSALNTLKAWSEQVCVPQSVFRQKPWTTMDLQLKQEDLLKTSAQADPVMGLVRRALHKFNGHCNFALGAAKVINTTLCFAMLTPSFVAPAASLLQYIYQMGTGGPEDYKLLQELYLDRRIDSRWKRLNAESTQSITAYNNAIMTQNPVLLSLSESFISALGGEETGSRIIGSHRLVARKSTHDDAIDCVQTHTTM